jgi:hypothetical protein
MQDTLFYENITLKNFKWAFFVQLFLNNYQNFFLKPNPNKLIINRDKNCLECISSFNENEIVFYYFKKKSYQLTKYF